MTKTLTLVAALMATHAVAMPRLLDDAPRQLASATLMAADPATSNVVQPAAIEGIGFGEHFGKTSAVGVVSVMGSTLIAAGIGSLTISLFAGPLIGLLINAFLPPILTTLAGQLIGNWDTPGRFGFWLPALGAFAVNIGAYLIASFFIGIAWTNPAGLLAYSLVTGFLMTGASVGLMHATQNKVSPTTITSFVPGVSDTALIPLAKVAL
ncbi:MAG: hypothetical protein ACO1OB_19535 [Archangium sp.]